MELKVWVEGIQRVVCGANYSTTCQDVVLALAHAMGRTGRFTLVERWRDSERPLTPAECPLQALHKWGEYAAEVRFFLIQADGNAANTSNNSNGSSNSSSGGGRIGRDTDRGPGSKSHSGYSKSQIRDADGGFYRSKDRQSPRNASSGIPYATSPSPSPRGGVPTASKLASQKSHHSQLHLIQQPEHLKRSSTFSGAHNYALQPPSSTSLSNHPALPPPSSSSYPSSQDYNNRPYHSQHQHQQPSLPSSSKNQPSSHTSNYNNPLSHSSVQHAQPTKGISKGDRTLVPPFVNGNDPGMSSHSSSNSSPRSPSGRPGPRSHQVTNDLSSSQTSYLRDGSATRSGDGLSRNYREPHPASTAQGAGPTPRGAFSAGSNVTSRPRDTVPAEQISQYPDSRQRQPRREHTPRSPAPPRRSSQGGQQQQQPQQEMQQQHTKIPAYPHHQSNYEQPLPNPYSQRAAANQASHSLQQQRHQRGHRQPASAGLPTAQPPEAFRASSPPSSSPVPPVPAPRHRTRPSPDPVEYENLSFPGGTDQHRQQPPQYEQRQLHQQPQKAPSPRRRERSQSRERRREETRDPPRDGAWTDRPTAGHTGRSTARSLPAPQISGGAPTWSQAGRGPTTTALAQGPHQSHQRQQQQLPNQQQQPSQRDQSQLSKSLPASGMNLLRRTNEVNRGGSSVGGSVDFVDSAVKRQQRHYQPYQAHAATDEDGRGVFRSNVDPSDTTAAAVGGRSMSSFASAVLNVRQHSRERSPRGDGPGEAAEKISEHRAPGDAFGRDDKAYGPSLSSDFSSPSYHSSQTIPTSSQRKGDNSQVGPYVPSSSHYTQSLEHNPPIDHARFPHQPPYLRGTTVQKTPSPREPSSPPPPFHPSSPPSFNAITLSPRHNSAFKEVSPRHSYPSSPSSPPTAFRFDQSKAQPGQHRYDGRDPPYQPAAQGGSLPHPNHPHDLYSHDQPQGPPAPEDSTHSRQASLEIEEYDLDQNFPDVSQRDGNFSMGVSSRGAPRDTVQRPGVAAAEAAVAGPAAAAHSESTPLEYRLDSGGVRPAPHRAEAEYLQLARLVSVQLERLKLVEAQIAEASAEISSLEEDSSHTDLKLQELAVDGAELEAEEAELAKEEAELERVEWANVLDGEQKREADIRHQIDKLEEQLKKSQETVEQLKSEEGRTSEDIEAEKEKQAAEREEKTKLEREATEKMEQLKAELKQMDATLDSQRRAVEKLEAELAEADLRVKEQDETLVKMEAELKEENLKDFHAHPVAKEPPPAITVEDFIFPASGYKKARPYTSASSDTVDDDTEDTDTGEAIIKILEGRLSPASPLSGELNKMSAMTSAQQTYKSALAAKNPNGVWV